jgi:hypothetical protein
MADGDVKKELLTVKGGKTRHFGFLKAGKTKLHGLVITPKRIAGPVIVELQQASGNTSKPLIGTVRFDRGEGLLLFEMDASPPGWLKSALKEAATQQGASLGQYDVRRYPDDQPPPVVEGTGPVPVAAVPAPPTPPKQPPSPQPQPKATAPAPPPPPPPSPPPPAADGAAQALKARMGRLAPDLNQVLTRKTPRVAEVQGLYGNLRDAVGRKDYASGLTVLDRLEPLVKAELAAPPPAPPPPPQPPAPPPATQTVAPPTGKKVIFTQSRLVWDAARKKAHAEIERLKEAIKKVYAQDEQYADVVAGLVNLDDVLAKLDTRLIDKLDEALNAATPEDRQARVREAQALLQQYKAYLTGNPLALALDNNPFTPLVACKNLLNAVLLLEKKLV